MVLLKEDRLKALQRIISYLHSTMVLLKVDLKFGKGVEVDPNLHSTMVLLKGSPSEQIPLLLS